MSSSGNLSSNTSPMCTLAIVASASPHQPNGKRPLKKHKTSLDQTDCGRLGVIRLIHEGKFPDNIIYDPIWEKIDPEIRTYYIKFLQSKSGDSHPNIDTDKPKSIKMDLNMIKEIIELPFGCDLIEYLIGHRLFKVNIVSDPLWNTMPRRIVNCYMQFANQMIRRVTYTANMLIRQRDAHIKRLEEQNHGINLQLRANGVVDNPCTAYKTYITQLEKAIVDRDNMIKKLVSHTKEFDQQLYRYAAESQNSQNQK